jgi:ATP-binding cassette subfamily B protein
VSSLSRLIRAGAAAERAAEVLGEPAAPYGTAHLPAGRGRIEFAGVTVRADRGTILEGIDLVVPGGALVAVVGRSGSGKSRLAALAGRLADPDEGEVLLDGVPVTRLERRELRRAVGYGFERPVLFGETLADAIAFGESTPSLQEVVAAARAARADDFIRRMPEGYRTRLADAPMSGGEAQRVGLARTFAHAGRVVVLDDVAASLDTVTEHQISQVLIGAMADRTRIVVAHRASTAARADIVVWLDRRGIRATAPHEQLWLDPDYRALFEPDGHSSGTPHATRVNGGSP